MRILLLRANHPLDFSFDTLAFPFGAIGVEVEVESDVEASLDSELI